MRTILLLVKEEESWPGLFPGLCNWMIHAWSLCCPHIYMIYTNMIRLEHPEQITLHCVAWSFYRYHRLLSMPNNKLGTMLHTGWSMKSKLSIKIIDHKNIISWSKLVEPAAPFLNVDFPLLHIKCALGSQ